MSVPWRISILWRVGLLGSAVIFSPLALNAQAAEKEEVEGPEVLLERMKWFRDTRADATGTIPWNARNKALRHIEANLASGILQTTRAIDGDRWVFLGPAPLYDSGVAFSGRVTSLAVHPQNPNTVYAGTAQGGIWKTVDGGDTWRPLTDQQDSLAIGSLALAPSNPDVVYAGTGEGNGGCDSYFGAGILKSTDGGESWTLVGQNTFAGSSVGVIVVHPSNPNVVWAGNSPGSAGFSCVNGQGPYGLFKSTDGGLTWYQINVGTQGWGVSDLVLTPGNPARMYAGLRQDGIYRTIDAGASWKKLSGGLPESDIARVDLAVDPNTPSRLFAAVGMGMNSRYHGTFRSDNGGNTWTILPTPSGTCHYWSLLDICTYNGMSVGNCWWNLYVAAAPDGGVWLGGLGVWRSPDLGWSWTDVCTEAVHIDQHAVAFAPDGKVWIGNDGGVFVTADNGTTWVNRNEGLGTVQFYPGASLHPDSSRFALCGTQDNGTLKYTGTPAWTQIWGGDGGYTSIDWSDPDRTWYVSSQYLSLQKTTDAGASFSSATQGLEDANTGEAAFIAPYAVCPDDPKTLVAGTRAVWKTQDGASTWNINSRDPLDTSEYPAYAVAFASTDQPCGAYFVGIRYNAVHRTMDGGANWTNITGPLALGAITDIAVDPSDSQVVYLALGNIGSAHLYKSTDALAPSPTWTQIDAGLPDTPFNAVLVDPESSNVVYIGTDVGVFRSTDGGTSWSLFMNGLPNAAVFDLAAEASTKTIIAFTHGRGAYRLVSGGPGEASRDIPMTAQRGSGDWIRVRYSPGCGGTNHAIYWGSGRPDQNLQWNGAACRLGSTGIAGFSPEPIAPGGLIYFVVVAQDSTTEGSYGKNSAGVERPEATSAGPCDMPQSLGDCLASY